jgi:hypothetical protein
MTTFGESFASSRCPSEPILSTLVSCLQSYLCPWSSLLLQAPVVSDQVGQSGLGDRE